MVGVGEMGWVIVILCLGWVGREVVVFRWVLCVGLHGDGQKACCHCNWWEEGRALFKKKADINCLFVLQFVSVDCAQHSKFVYGLKICL